MQKGYEFADKLKQIVKNKDINLFCGIYRLSYKY